MIGFNKKCMGFKDDELKNDAYAQTVVDLVIGHSYMFERHEICNLTEEMYRNGQFNLGDNLIFTYDNSTKYKFEIENGRFLGELALFFDEPIKVVSPYDVKRKINSNNQTMDVLLGNYLLGRITKEMSAGSDDINNVIYNGVKPSDLKKAKMHPSWITLDISSYDHVDRQILYC